MKYLNIILFLFLSSNAFSHGGGLDKKGCHKNRNTGNYHCHRASSSQGKALKSGNMSIGNEDYFNLSSDYIYEGIQFLVIIDPQEIKSFADILFKKLSFNH